MDTPKKHWAKPRYRFPLYIWVFGATIVVCAVIGFLLFSDRSISTEKAVLAIVFAAIGIFIIGWFQQRFLSFLNARGVALERLAVFGAGDAGVKLAQRIRDQGLDEGQLLVGVFDNRESRAGEDVNDFGLAGDWQSIKHLAASKKIDHVIICLPFEAEARLKYLLDEIIGIAVKVTLVPEDSGDISQVIELNNIPIQGWRKVAKATLDRVGATLGLLVISPILLLIAILIKIDSPGPVFFLQDRVGYNDRIFKIFKFRTMHGPGEEGAKMSQAIENDPRITRIGHFLRRFSIDELPQALNVVLGEMSLVGPRPHAPGDKAAGVFFYDAFEGYASRHRVKPGITGWAQVNGLRGHTQTKDMLIKRVQYDLYYVNNWSFFFDIEILLRTIPAVFRGAA